MATSIKTNVFQFMSVRSPQSVEPRLLRNFYIRDEYLSPDSEENISRKLREIFSMRSESQIGKILYQKIFCERSDQEINQGNAAIVQAVLETLDFKSIRCEEDSSSPPETLINELEEFPYIYNDYKYYLLPTKLETIQSGFNIRKLITAKKIIEKQIAAFDKKKLLKDLNALFESELLTEVVYRKRAYHPDFQQLRNLLFERLYLLYILRRITTVNLEEIIEGLQTLHTLEFLAVEDFLETVMAGGITTPSQRDLIKFLPSIFPEFRDFDLSLRTNNFHFIDNSTDLEKYFESTPVIHPIVAQLHWYRRPFNKITPIGIGDLKVVKQWLTGYKVGEISHIHNIMKGETNERNHRHLEKTEEVFSFASETSEDSRTDNESTDRFETKKEAESVIKSELSVGAKTDLTYNNPAYGITINVGANFAYNRSGDDTQRSAMNYAREVMEKTVSQIQSRSTENRSITKLFETEETNKHGFTNTSNGATHTSGIYRWLDKKYKAALYNYGKRLMFEFIVPEPAAFYVMSKLKAAEFDINVPQKPDPPVYDIVKIINPDTAATELQPADITEDLFNKLRLKYDLSEFSFPPKEISIPFSDLEKKNNLAASPGSSGDAVWSNYQYKSKSPEGYNIKEIRTLGSVNFEDKKEPDGKEKGDEANKNKWLFYLNGWRFWNESSGDKNSQPWWALDKIVTMPQPIPAKSGEIVLDISFQDLQSFSMMVFLDLEIDSDYKLDWQTKVYKKIQEIEQRKVDRINQEKDIDFVSRMSDYRNKLNEIEANTVNDIIQGRSEAFNRMTIRDELKKHCLTMIAKEFDSFETDDILSSEDAIEDKKVEIEYGKFYVGEKIVGGGGMSSNIRRTITVAEFVEFEREVDYPKINIEISRKKARFIQFLEQAFEWENIAYLFYPYFWAAERKWIQLMNRLDYTDNNMTAFLKAGSVRILVAVTPQYNNAVLHFLGTREPWEGGPLPVIGDPLFIPIYEEIRQQQDDLLNAVQEGESWDFELPTSLVYLQDSSSAIPEDFETVVT